MQTTDAQSGFMSPNAKCCGGKLPPLCAAFVVACYLRDFYSFLQLLQQQNNIILDLNVLPLLLLYLVNLVCFQSCLKE